METALLERARKEAPKDAYAVVSSEAFKYFEAWFGHFLTLREFELLQANDFEVFNAMRKAIDTAKLIIVSLKEQGMRYKREVERSGKNGREE